MADMLHLVGSRFYGTHRDDSDWDYLGEDNPTNRNLCDWLGLEQVPSPVTGGLHYWGKVKDRYFDVLLVPDLELRLRARDEVALLPNVRELTKGERHRRIREIIDAAAPSYR